MGKPINQAYKAATIFVDHDSRFIHWNMCESTGGEKALQVKLRFEKMVKDSGIQILKFCSDNGVFTSKSFNQAMMTGQDITFCGITDHFQNGIAE